MLKGIRNIAVIALAAGLMWHCNGERVVQSQTDTIGPPLGKSTAAHAAAPRAVVVVHLSRDGAAVSDAIVEFSRSIAGRSASYRWSGMTDENGQARVEIAADDVTGYYRARALWNAGGNIRRIGSWSSIPINGGYEAALNLPIGGKARVTASSPLTRLEGEIAIGLVVSLTGSLTSTGIPINNGFELAREEVNRSSLLGGATLKFIIEDDESTVEGAIAAYEGLIERDGVSIILGPYTSTMSKAVFPIAQERGVVAISPTSNAPGLSAIGDFVFRTSLPVDRLLPSGVAATQRALGYRRVATLYDRVDVFSRGSDAAFVKAFRDNGVEVVRSETFQTGDTDFSAQLTRIKEANPDAISLSALPIEMPEIMIQGRQLGIPFAIPFICPTLVIGEVQRAGNAAEGSITIALWSAKTDAPGNRAFVENYRAKFGGEADAFAAQAYTSVHLLARAIADAQSTEASAIRDALATLRDVPTVLGDFSFDAHGDGVHDAITLIVENGKFEVFDP